MSTPLLAAYCFVGHWPVLRVTVIICQHYFFFQDYTNALGISFTVMAPSLTNELKKIYDTWSSWICKSHVFSFCKLHFGTAYHRDIVNMRGDLRIIKIKLLKLEYAHGSCESRSVVSDTLRHHGILQARILQCSLSLLQGIFSTQGLNLGLPHCRYFRRILYQLGHKGSPCKLCWGRGGGG